MKIGIFPLSGDPPHIGHCASMTKALNEGLVDRVLCVPAKQNPWKGEPIGTFEERCKMVENMCRNIDNCEMEPIEGELFPPYYTCFTLDAIYKKYGPDNEYWLIGGTDTVDSLSSWFHYETMIKGKFKVIAFTREGKKPETDEVEYVLVESDIPDLSSTYIRQLASEGKNLYPYIPESNLEMCQQIYGDVERQTEFYV